MEDFAQRRLNICKQCPLFKKNWTGKHICDSSKYMNPITKETSFLPKKGWIRGCHCTVEIKVTNINENCVAGLW